MNWTMVMMGFGLAVFTGAVAVTLLAQHRAGWTRQRRIVVASSVLPAITVAATLLGLLVIRSADHGGDEKTEALAIQGLLLVGLGFASLAFVAGLIGAGLAGRRRP